MTLVETVLQALAITAFAVGVLLVLPLFLIPHYLLRQGMLEWKTRVIGWAVFGAILMVSALVFSGLSPIVAYLARWEVWIGVAVAIFFAAWWDVTRTRPKGRG
ncbi:MAG: hypothetical protein ACE5HJ_04600 [Thermoplasmata archaeon]